MAKDNQTVVARSTKRSKAAFAEAAAIFPGGVNSPVRSWKSVGGNPFFVAKAKGPALWDVDRNRYVDFVNSWGAIILGHCDQKIVAAVRKQARKGSSFGAPTELESRLGAMIRKAMPAVEMLRFVSSGTEACMHALRVARGFTGREKIVKFEGCYHGASDPLLVKAGSGVATFGLPDSAGVPAAVAANTLTAPFNDAPAVRALFDANKNQIAAVILEPIVGNAGVLIPDEGFLQSLSELTKQHGALLIVDEVMTGFRVAYGGAQQLYGVKPDLVTMGKVIGGGLPCAAYGGRKDVMEKIAPLGPVYQAGTLSGNPLAMAAGIAALKQLQEPGVYAALEEKSAAVCKEIATAAEETGWRPRVCLNRVGSMFTLFFCTGPVRDYAEAKQADAQLYARFFTAMLDGGVYLPPSQFEAAFVSLAIDRKDIRRVGRAAKAAFEAL